MLVHRHRHGRARADAVVHLHDVVTDREGRGHAWHDEQEDRQNEQKVAREVLVPLMVVVVEVGRWWVASGGRWW